jgi:hypothetical protein
LAKGDSENIAKWTMKQTDGRKISDGMSALSYKVIQAGDDKKEAEFDIKWCVIAFNWVEDWPPDQVFPISTGGHTMTSGLIHSAFMNVSDNAYHHPVSEELLLRLRPDDRHKQWLAEWEKWVADLETSRQEARDIAAGKPLRRLTSQPAAP